MYLEILPAFWELPAFRVLGLLRFHCNLGKNLNTLRQKDGSSLRLGGESSLVSRAICSVLKWEALSCSVQQPINKWDEDLQRNVLLSQVSAWHPHVQTHHSAERVTKPKVHIFMASTHQNLLRNRVYSRTTSRWNRNMRHGAIIILHVINKSNLCNLPLPSIQGIVCQITRFEAKLFVTVQTLAGWWEQTISHHCLDRLQNSRCGTADNWEAQFTLLIKQSAYL